MKILFIGGTGIISTASTALAAQSGLDITLLSRGQMFIHGTTHAINAIITRKTAKTNPCSRLTWVSPQPTTSLR